MRQTPVSTTEPPGLIYRFLSILERIRLADLFPTDEPLKVELGSGDGSFLVDYARLHPDHNFLRVVSSTNVFPPWLARRWRRAGWFICGRMMRLISSRWSASLRPARSFVWPKRQQT